MHNRQLGRRSFLKSAATGSLGALSVVLGLDKGAAAQQAVRPSAAKPEQPSKVTLNVRDFGATGNGAAKDTAAIQQAIDRCAVFGGGQVHIPAGDYLAGSIQLRSDVTLRFEEGATLTGSPDEADYPITQVRWEGKWVQGHTGLIYAIGAARIAIAGPGKIAGYTPPHVLPNGMIPVRRPVLIEFIRCSDIRLEDFSTSYERMWSIHPADCENVSIRNLTIRSTGGNGDGIDVDSCRHVRIEGCDIESGDDCISLKSGRGSEGYLLHKPTEDVRIANCTFNGLIFACIGIGSETSGGIRNVRIEQCRFKHARTHAIYIKSRVGRGAFIEDIVANDLDVAGTEGGFLRLNLTTSGKQDQNPVTGIEGIPSVGNLRFSNVRVNDVPVLVQATECAAQKPVDEFSLNNVTGTCGKGIYLANMRRVSIAGIKVTGYAGSFLNIANVTGHGLEGAATINAPALVEPVAAVPESGQRHS
jgi:polygalacturonase